MTRGSGVLFTELTNRILDITGENANLIINVDKELLVSFRKKI